MNPADAVASIHFSDEHYPHTDLIDLLDSLAMDASDLSYVREGLDLSSLPSWDLWRQDDHGNKAVVQRFTGHAKAEHSLKEFENRGHKQTYWLEEVKHVR